LSGEGLRVGPTAATMIAREPRLEQNQCVEMPFDKRRANGLN
jgi:hypothetical protein